jgi:predicted trehalose synthase
MVPQDGRRRVDPRKRDLSSARDMAVRIRSVEYVAGRGKGITGRVGVHSRIL